MAETIIMAERHSTLPAACQLGQTRFEPAPPMARFVFRGAIDAQSRAAQALGIQFPQILRAISDAGISIHWQGPDEFLIVAPAASKDPVFEAIEKACGDLPHSLVDVSHRNVAFTLEGSDVELLLATAVQLDLSSTMFPVGMSTRTLFAKADITLWRQSDHRFHVEVWRSFLPYVFGILNEGSRGL
jgi:sarcosine oxidase subunit gamma